MSGKRDGKPKNAKAQAKKNVRRTRLGRGKGNHGACEWHLRAPYMRLLSRALDRVPPGPNLDRMAHYENKTWDLNTGLYLRKRGSGD